MSNASFQSRARALLGPKPFIRPATFLKPRIQVKPENDPCRAVVDLQDPTTASEDVGGIEDDECCKASFMGTSELSGLHARLIAFLS